MGTRGPVGKRAEHRIRRNKPTHPVTEGESGVRTESPFVPDLEHWHPVAVEFWEAAQNSGQSAFYEESDWMTLYFLCEAMSRELKPQFVGFQDGVQTVTDPTTGKTKAEKVSRPIQAQLPIKGASLNAFRAFMSDLLITDGQRRRMSMELSKAGAAATPATPGDAAVVAMEDYLRTAAAKKKS